jgi:hypothetical protein
MKRADGTSFWVCNGCGSIPIANERENLFVCSTCDGPVEFSGSTVETMTLIQPLKRSRVTFSKIEMPYALKLLDQELTTFMGSGMRFVTSKTVGRLKENFLEWASAPSEGGGATPQPPLSYGETVKQTVGVSRTAELVPDTLLPAPPKTTIYLDPNLIGAQKNDFVITNPNLEQEIVNFSDGVSSAAIPEIGKYPEDTELPKIGGGTNIIGHNYDAVSKIIELKQQMGGGTNIIGHNYDAVSKIIELKQQMGGGTNIIGNNDDAISKIVDLKQQMGGAPIDSIGKDTIPIKQDLEEELISPFKNEVAQMPKSILKQTGGMAPINPVADVAFSIGGTDIDSKIFSQPALSEEPYVIANPFTSPPLLTSDPKPESPQHIPVPATVEQPVQGSQEITNAINVFENSEIRVIKLA